MNPKLRHGEQMGFPPGGKGSYLRTLRDEYQNKENGLLLQLRAAADEVEREALNKAIEELRSDYKMRVANAKWNLYFG